MPKYVFEVSLILPASDELTPGVAGAISVLLETQLGEVARRLGHVRYETAADEPFEHVTGDWLPPDDKGIVKVGPSRPIDL